jgi:uncharacterized membrane protein YhaH (DUF805 family)
MNFADAIKNGFKKYVQFRGVASRSEYWYWVLFTFLVSVVLGTIDAVMAAGSLEQQATDPFAMSGTLGNIASLVFLLPNLTVGVRRMRDAGFSAWFLLLSVLPLIPLVLTFGTLISEIAAFAGTADPADAVMSFLGALAFIAMNPTGEETAAFLAAFSGTFTWLGVTLLVSTAVAIFYFVVYLRPTKTFEQGNKLVSPAPEVAAVEDAGTTA